MKRNLFSIIILMFFLSCSKKDEKSVTTTPVDEEPPKVVYYIEANINGKPFKAEYVLNGDYITSVGNDNFIDLDNCSISYKSSLEPMENKALPGVTIIFRHAFKQVDFDNCTTDEYTNFNTLFKKDSIPYAPGNYAYGARVEYFEGDSLRYRSDYEQDASDYFIVEELEFKPCGDSKCVIITGKFSCKAIDIIDFNNKDKYNITDGKFKLSFQSLNSK